MAKKTARNTRGKIVSAAWKLFYEQGYEHTTVEEIIDLSHTSKGSFYHYFDGKDALLGTLAYVRNRAHIRTKNVTSTFAASVIGLLLGMCSSFLGIGGGPMNLAVLYYFFSMGTKQAAVNSILIILLSQAMSLMMSLAAGSVPAFEVPVLLGMVCAGAIGGFVSARLHKKLSAEITDKLFSALLVVIFLICCYNAIKWM